MFTFKDKQYELKFNTQRIKMVEASTKTPLVGEWMNNNGMLSLNTVEIIFQLCLKETGADSFVPQKEGLYICDEFMKENGYGQTVLLIQNQLMEDVPFLFRAN